MLCCRKSGETGEMNSRKKLAVACGSHKKCCDLKLNSHSAFVNWCMHWFTCYCGSSRDCHVLEKQTVF